MWNAFFSEKCFSDSTWNISFYSLNWLNSPYSTCSWRRSVIHISNWESNRSQKWSKCEQLDGATNASNYVLRTVYLIANRQTITVKLSRVKRFYAGEWLTRRCICLCERVSRQKARSREWQKCHIGKHIHMPQCKRYWSYVRHEASGN